MLTLTYIRPLGADGYPGKRKQPLNRLQPKQPRIRIIKRNKLALKELYLHENLLDKEVFAIKSEISKLPVRIRHWKATVNESGLIVTDFQNYFISDHSHAFIPSAHAIIPKIQMLIAHFRSLGRPVYFTRHVNDPVNAGSMDWWWKDLIEEGSSASAIINEINTGKDTVITKHQYDAFHGTELEALLHDNNIRFPVICGVMTNLCCETSVRSAFVRGFQPVLPVDATATYNRELHVATFKNLAFGFSPVMTAEDIINALKE